jgi:hypothetical protein
MHLSYLVFTHCRVQDVPPTYSGLPYRTPGAIAASERPTSEDHPMAPAAMVIWWGAAAIRAATARGDQNPSQIQWPGVLNAGAWKKSGGAMAKTVAAWEKALEGGIEWEGQITIRCMQTALTGADGRYQGGGYKDRSCLIDWN